MCNTCAYVVQPCTSLSSSHFGIFTDQLICENPDFSILCTNLEVAGLTAALATGTWTLFAPNNEAFLRLPPSFVQSLNSDQELLTKTLLFHAVEDHVWHKNSLPCVAGHNLITMANGKDSRTLCDRNDDRVPVPVYQKGKGNPSENPPAFLSFDQEACNGVVHTLDAVLLFDDI